MNPKRFKYALKENKIFPLYMNLPKELRIMIVDEMKPADRCRMTRCSSMCYDEAIMSRNFIYSLEISSHLWNATGEFRGKPKKFITIDVSYGKHRSPLDRVDGYSLKFEEMEKTVAMQYLTLDTEEVIWRDDLRKRKDFVRMSYDIFVNILNLHQHTLKSLTIGECFTSMMNFDSKINKMSNLEDLTIHCKINYLRFFSKLGRRLNYFNYCVKTPIHHLENYDQIYEISYYLDIPSLHLNNEQFRQISAPSFRIHIGNLKIVDIQNFIISWQNGEIGDNFESGQWILTDSKFDYWGLFDFFGNEEYGWNMSYIKSIINHSEQPGKRAKLEFIKYHNLLTFDTKIRR